MGDKIAIVSEKKFAYKGLFNIKETYEYLRHYLEDTKQYEETLREYEEVNDRGKRKLAAVVEWKQIYSDVFAKYIKYKISLEGNETTAEVNSSPVTMCKGKVQLEINAYLEIDPIGKKPKGTISEFVNKVFRQYVNKSEEAKAAGSLAKEVDEVIHKLKVSLNSITK